MCAQSFSHVQLFETPWTVAHQATLSMEFSRQEYWSGLPCPPPGDFPTRGSNPGLPHCKWILYCLNHQGSPRILEWRAYPFSRGSSWPRNQAGFFCIAGGSFTSWTTREAPSYLLGGLYGEGVSGFWRSTFIVEKEWSQVRQTRNDHSFFFSNIMKCN